MFFIGLGPVVDNQNTRILRFFIICNCKPNCSEEIVYFYVLSKKVNKMLSVFVRITFIQNLH